MIPAAPAREPEPAATALTGGRQDARLGKGVTFDGTLKFTGTLVIDGTFTGHIREGDTLVIGPSATVTADVACGAIEVFGAVQGSLIATRAVELRAAARVAADVTTPSLRIADGAQLDGMVRMRGAGSARKADRPKRQPSVSEPKVDEPLENASPAD